MGLGNNRVIKYVNEGGIGGAIYGQTIGALTIGGTSVVVNNPGGSANGVQAAAAGMTLYFLDGAGEAPKLISAATNTSTQTTLSIPALTANHSDKAKVFIDQAPTTLLLLESLKVARDPKNWSPTPYTQGRSANVARVPGRQETKGSVSFMARPTVNAGLLVKAIGQDLVYGTVSGSPLSTTTTGTNTAGASTLNVTLGTGWNPGDFLQIESNSSSLRECHKVLSVASNVITLQTGETLLYTHNAGASVTRVIAPFTHTVPGAQSVLNAIALEDYVPYDDFSQPNFLTTNSYFVTGVLFDKVTIEGKSTDGLMVTADLLAQSKEVNTYSGSATTPSENPFFFQQESVLASGTTYNRTTAMKIEIKNNLQVVYSKSGSSKPFAIRAGMQDVTGEFQLFEDAATQLAFWTNFVNNTAFNLTWTTTDAATGNFISFVMTKVVLDGFDDEDFKPAELVGAKVPFTAYLDTSNSAQITMTIGNAQWLPF